MEKVYGIVINISGFEPVVKLVDEDVYNWVILADNKKAKIDMVPAVVYEKLLESGKNLKYFKNNSNELVKPADYENFKAEIAPAIKSDFKSLNEAKQYASDNGYTFVSSIIKYLQA